jgi:nucleotide-binding universal stress UspA family protein
MRVLIASDLSEASDEAVKQGVELAAGSPVALCHVMAEPGMHALFPQDYEEDLQRRTAMQPRVADALRDQLARLLPHANVTPEVFIEIGSEADALLRRAEAWGAELIAVGTHGKKGLRRLLLGSLADQIVRSAHCQVLVARAAREGAVLAATDLTDPGLPAIEAAAAEAERRGRKLVVMHAMEFLTAADASLGLMGALPVLETEDTRSVKRALASQIIESALQRLGAKGEIVIAEDDAPGETLRLADALPAELIVVGTHGRSGLARVVVGSRATRIIENAPCSVLVVRQDASSAHA